MRLVDRDIFWNENGIKICRVGESVDFLGLQYSTLEMECPLIINDNCVINAGRIGAFTKICSNTKIYNTDKIGRFTMIGKNCIIGCSSMLQHLSQSSYFAEHSEWLEFEVKAGENATEDCITNRLITGKIIIGNDVYIGNDVIILPGVEIGDGAFISDHSVVADDVAPYYIMSGNPAQKVGKRFDKNTIDFLLDKAWWERDIDTIWKFYNSKTIEQINSEKIKTGLITTLISIDYAKDRIVRHDKEREVVLFSGGGIARKVRGGISKCVVYNAFSKNLSGNGWLLPSWSYDSVHIVGDDLNVEADLHKIRRDIHKKYPHYGESNCGIEFDSKLLKDISGTHKLIAYKGEKIVYEKEIVIDVIDYGTISFRNNIDFRRIVHGLRIATLCDDAEGKYRKFIEGNVEVSEYSDNIIICAEQWEDKYYEIRREGKNAIPLWFFAIWKDYAIDYHELKTVSAVIVQPIEKMLKIVKEVLNKDFVMTYGNCQIGSINAIMQTSDIILDKYTIISVPPIQDLKEEREIGLPKELLENIDVLIYQIIKTDNKFSRLLSSEEILKNVSSNATRIIIPNVYWKGYHIQVCGNKYNPELLNFRGGAFPYGDANIQKLWDKYSTEEIVNMLSAENYYTADEVEKAVEETTKELMKREKACDVVISDYIVKNYKTTYLFYSVNHPTNIVLGELVRRIFLHIGISVNDLDVNNAVSNDAREIHIYPSVRKALGLRFDKEKFTWLKFYRQESISFEEYVRDYIDFCKPEWKKKNEIVEE